MYGPLVRQTSKDISWCAIADRAAIDMRSVASVVSSALLTCTVCPFHVTY